MTSRRQALGMDPHDPVELMIHYEHERQMQALNKANELSRALLDKDIDRDRVMQLMDELHSLGHPSERVQQCMLSRYAMRVALHGNSLSHEPWVEALTHIHVTTDRVNDAARQGMEMRDRFSRKNQHEALRVAVYQAFLGNDDDGIIDHPPVKERGQKSPKKLTSLVHSR